MRDSSDFTVWVVQGFIVLVLVIFLLVESPMLTNKVIRFFARTTGEAEKAGAMLAAVTRKIRDYLVARTADQPGPRSGGGPGPVVPGTCISP